MTDMPTFFILATVWLYVYLSKYVDVNVDRILAKDPSAPDPVLYTFECFFSVAVIFFTSQMIANFYETHPILISLYTFFCTVCVFVLDIQNPKDTDENKD
jgi:predicted tellurium resistance membrane protein TerC